MQTIEFKTKNEAKKRADKKFKTIPVKNLKQYQ